MKDMALLSEFVDINPSVALTRGSEYSCVMMENITPGRRYISADEWKIFKGGGSRFQKGDVLFARITPCLENGKIAQYIGIGDVGFGSTEFFVFRHKEGISDPGYVFYLASSDFVRKPAEKSMFGASGRQRADLNVVRDIEVPAPPLLTQRKIASILSAYDDLIENNTRRIRILEEMAQAIYREWFVYFRFPGYAGVRIVEREGGRAPEGWETEPFANLVEIDPPTTVNKEEEKPYVDMGCITTSSMVIECTERRKGNSGSKFKSRDVIFPRITPSVENGKGAFVQFLNEGEVALGSTEFIIFRERELNAEYVYFLSREGNFRENAIHSMIGVSGRQRVQNACFRNISLAVPPKRIQAQFQELVSPMFRQVYILSRKNINLRQTRDLLLPKLVSGEVEVGEVEVAGETVHELGNE